MRRGAVGVGFLVATVAGIAIVEYIAPRNARLVESLLVFAGAIGFAWAAAGRLREVALVVCSLAFGLAVLQVLAPLLQTKRGSGTAAGISNENLVSSRDVLGWGARHPGVFHIVKTAGDGRIVFDVHATIDDALRRKTGPAAGTRPIAFFGDSFIFGDGRNDDETLPQAFADLNHGKIPVLNFGFSGWAPSQNLAALQHGLYKSELVAPRRMILFTSLFHVERIACKGDFALGSGPRYVIDGDTVKQAGTCVGAMPRFVTSILRFVRSLVPGSASTSKAPTRRDVETYIKIIEAFATTAQRDDNVGTTVLMEPGGDEYVAGTGFDQAKIVSALRAAGVDVLVKPNPPAAEDRLYRIEGDGHPTGLANRATAQLIEAHLRRVDPQALETGQAAGD